VKLPDEPPSFTELMRDAALRAPQRVIEIFDLARPVDPKGRYLHWDEMKRRNPPGGLSHSEWWLATTFARNSVRRELPLLRAVDGRPFSFSNVDLVQELVHRIDQQASGQILADDTVTSLRGSNRYLVSSLVEEAITSSQLEGASTTREVAKELLATGRAPRDKSELMIVNNYQAMQYAQELAGQPISPDEILTLHRIVTAGTLDDPAHAGRFQTANDERIAVYWTDGTLLHRPPRADELPARIQALCAFANGQDSDGFTHPVVRAIIVHFALAYDHPFEDGNGRTSRVLFYWAMLNGGYWLAQYLTISAILKRAPSKYVTSFLYTESDSNDVTYFVISQLQFILRAIESLHQYLARKIAETREIEALIHGSSQLNHRQLSVVGEALREPTEPFTIRAQARVHRVTYESARSDLLGLERLGLFVRTKVGKKYVFRPQPDLAQRLHGLE